MEERLLESEEYYKTLVETSSEAVLTADTHGTIMFISYLARFVFGISPEHDTSGITILNWIDPEEHERAMGRMHGILSGYSQEEAGEYRLQKNDGTPFWGELSFTPLINTKGTLSGLFIKCRNVTERKRAEDEIIRVNRVYSVISQINQMIVRTRAEDTLLSEACRITAKYGKFNLTWIGMRENDDGPVTPVAWSGSDERFLTKNRLVSAGE
ncbi:MAG: PAS domain S-box protein, partial [Spirochaetaceae bacterium]